MNTNHHIAMQFAAERQRDLRASSGGFRLADLFARWARRPLPGREVGDQLPARGAEAAPVPAAEMRVSSQQHIRRSPAAPGARRAVGSSNSRRGRSRERTPS